MRGVELRASKLVACEQNVFLPGPLHTTAIGPTRG